MGTIIVYRFHRYFTIASFVVRTQSQCGLDESYVQLTRRILGTKTNSIFFRCCKTITTIVILYVSLRYVKPENVKNRRNRQNN